MNKNTVYISALIMLTITVTIPAAPVHETGMGVHSLGLAGAATTFSDHNAIFSNPGGLAFAHQRYFFTGLSFVRQSATIDAGAGSTDNKLMRLRFTPAGIIVPVPVKRGGLTLAFAYYNPYLFDDMIEYTQRFTDAEEDPVNIFRDYSTFGGLSYWSASGGLQVAPGIGLGCTFSLITGEEDTRFTFLRTDNGVVTDTFDHDFHDHYHRDYQGFEFRCGLLYIPISRLRFGIRLTIPRYIHFDESIYGFVPADQRDSITYSHGISGKLYTSIEGGIGVSCRFDFLSLFFDFHGRTPYSVLYPNDDISGSSDAGRSRFGLSAAIESPYLKQTIAFRLGYSFDQYDTHRMVVKYDNADMPEWRPSMSDPQMNIHGFTVGISLEKGAVGMDAGYRFLMWRLDTKVTSGEIAEERRMLHEPVLAVRLRF